MFDVVLGLFEFVEVVFFKKFVMDFTPLESDSVEIDLFGEKENEGEAERGTRLEGEPKK